MCLAEFNPEQTDKLKAILRRAAKPEKSDELEPKLQDALGRIRQVLEEAQLCLQIVDLGSARASDEKNEIKTVYKQTYRLVNLLEKLTKSQPNVFQSMSMEFLLHTGTEIEELPKQLKWVAENLYEQLEGVKRHHPTTEGYCLKVAVKKLGRIYFELTGKTPGYSQRKKNMETPEDVRTRCSC